MKYTPSVKSGNAYPAIRKIPRKSVCYRGYLPSLTLGDHLTFESRSIEKKLYRFLEFLFLLGIVKSIHPQPFKIEYSPTHFYHPDVIVIFRSSWLKPWLIDGKGGYFDKNKLKELKPRFRSAIGFARKHGYIFHIITAAHLSHVDDEILPFLKTHRGKAVTENVAEAVVEALTHFGPTHPNKLSSLLRSEHEIDVPVELIWRLAADGRIFCNLNARPAETVVFAPIPINFRNLSKKVLFRLPFEVIGGEHDPVLRRRTDSGKRESMHNQTTGNF